MKKTFAILLVAILLFIGTACGQKQSSAQSHYEPNSSRPNNQAENNSAARNDYSEIDQYEEIELYCDRLISQGDFLTAYTYIKEKANVDSSYNNLLHRYANMYVEDSLSTAKTYADQGNYQQAIYILEEANKVYHCSEFTLKMEDYRANLPCKLCFCKRIDDEDYKYMLDAEDCFGNHYQEVFGFGGSLASDSGGYAVFYLNGKYHTLSGVFVGSNNLYEDMEVQCKIYADGNLIYESSKLSRTSPPVNINLDITGTEQLRVEYIYYTWWTSEAGCILDLTVS